MNIIDALSDSRFFRLLFKDLSTWHAWQIYLKALFGIPLEGKKELEVFRKCTGLDRPPKERPGESFVICGRRSGKSFISSVIAVYLATFQDWRKVLGPGERGYIFIIAVNKPQAKIIKNYISGILERTPHFRKLIDKDLAWEIELKNGVTISIKTCNYRSIRGYTVLCAIAEELAFWRSEDSANPDKEIMAALRPALATIPDSLLLGISTPYSRSGVLYESFKKYHGQAGGPLIWKAASKYMNPTLNEGIISVAMAEDPASAQAEYMAEFRTDMESFLPLEVVEGAIVPGRFELPKIARAEYFGFADPSGGRQDGFTLGIAHCEKKGKIILDVIRERKPPFEPEQVVAEFSQLLSVYKINRVEGDKYAGEWVTSSFRKQGIKYRPSPLSRSEIYAEFLPIIMNGSVELLDNKRLAVQLAGLERRTRSGGKDQIDHGPGGHDDLANSAAGACVLAKRTSEGSRANVRPISMGQKEPPGLWESFS